MKKRVALTDWDGTIRRFFTLNSWMKFLMQEGLIDSHHFIELDRYFESYRNGDLDHELLVERTATIYAKSLRGCSRNTVMALADSFKELDREDLFGYSKHLFEYLRNRAIDVIVVSGAPQEILEQYRGEFSLNEVYGLQLAVDGQGIYNGKIVHNPGRSLAKGDIVNMILKNTPAIIGLGNSVSDIPLLKRSSLSVIVDNPGLNAGGRSIHIRSEETDGTKLVKLLRKELEL